MTDLLQVVQSGHQYNDSLIEWDELGQRQYVVPAANRRRILDREHDRGVTPGADGWLTTRICCYVNHEGAVWQRIRWEPLGPTDIHNLDDRSA